VEFVFSAPGMVQGFSRSQHRFVETLKIRATEPFSPSCDTYHVAAAKRGVETDGVRFDPSPPICSTEFSFFRVRGVVPFVNSATKDLPTRPAVL
jgi:hypothetical protein